MLLSGRVVELIRWDNGITHSMSDKDWDRPTRNALDYIMKRSCSVDSFQTNILAGLSGMHHYFKYYNSQLMDQVSFLQGVGDMSPQALVGDASLTFLVLSCCRWPRCKRFIRNFRRIFPLIYILMVCQMRCRFRRFFSTDVRYYVGD